MTPHKCSADQDNVLYTFLVALSCCSTPFTEVPNLVPALPTLHVFFPISLHHSRIQIFPFGVGSDPPTHRARTTEWLALKSLSVLASAVSWTSFYNSDLEPRETDRLLAETHLGSQCSWGEKSPKIQILYSQAVEPCVWEEAGSATCSTTYLLLPSGGKRQNSKIINPSVATAWSSVSLQFSIIDRHHLQHYK